MDLIEQARVHELDTEIDPPIPPGDWCAACHCAWPCLTSQLAEQFAAEKARVARLEKQVAAFKALEWDDNTDVNQCAWCMGWKRYGHHDGGGKVAALAPAEAAP